MWNWYSLTDCVQNNLSWSAAQLCQTTSRTAVVWNQPRCLTDSLQAAAVRGTVWLHTVQGWKVFTVEPPLNSGLCTSRYQEATHRSQLLRTRLTFSRSVMMSVAVSTMGITELIFFELTLGWRWTASITAMSCCLSRRFQQSTVSQNVVYSQNNMLLTAKFVIILCSVISQGKVVALDRWGVKWNHLSMTPRLTTEYAKNYCNRTLIAKVIVENVVTCFLWDTWV